MVCYAMDHLTPYNVLISLFTCWAAVKVTRYLLHRRGSARLIRLKGPPNNNIIFGRAGEMLTLKDRGATYGRWAGEHGPVFQLPIQLGNRVVILCDPKAIGHLFSKDTFTYFRPVFGKAVFKAFFGPNMLFAESEDHRRQRRALTPAFSNAALRTVTSVFYDSAYKVKANWSASFESSDEAIIDVQNWMNRITLDSVGIAGFGHDFKALEGHESPVYKAFGSFSESGSSSRRFFFLLGPIFPQIVNVPTQRSRMFQRITKATSEIASRLLEDSQREKESSQDKSILGLLVKGETDDTSFKLNHEEVVSQNLLLLAGYETTSVTLSWALVELARNPEIQNKLRDELLEFVNSDPTWDQLTSGLPYLDAVVHETLRFHSPVEELDRVAVEDDVIPLGSPIETPSGQTVDSLFVPKGTQFIVPVSFINRNENFWGPDANSFAPERWLQENPYMPKELQGHRHLLTFANGPRICLGRGFALAEVKAVLSVLIRNFSFELLNGPTTKLDVHISVFPRPTLDGEEGIVLPMRVRQVLG